MTHPRRTIPWLVAATLAVGVGVAVAQPAAAAVGCRVDYTVTNQWASGFGADVKITNLGDPVSAWTLTWSFTGRPDGDAGVERDGDAERRAVTAKNVSYNGGRSPRARARRSGSTAPGRAATRSPTSFALNGTTCTGGTTTPTSTPTDAPTATPRRPPPRRPPPRPPRPPAGAWQAEKLDRGLISVRSGSSNLVQWRLLGTEAGEHRLHRLPRRHQDRRTDHGLDQLPRRGRVRERHLHGPRRGERGRAGGVGPVADVRQRVPRRADPAAQRRSRGQRRQRRRPGR